MRGHLKWFLRDERGITALETAIILIAFVVVAAVFAFTVLSAGTYSTERGKEAIYAGLSEVRGTMELKGSVIAKGLSSSQIITEVVFTLGSAAGGEAIDLTAPSNNKVVIDYRDQNQLQSNLSWTVSWTLRNDSDNLLEEGELAQITVPLSGTLSSNLGTNTQFALEIKPPKGAVLNIERTTPAYIDPVMDLH